MQYKYVALSVTSVGVLMSGIDARIVVVGMPTIAKQLGADVEGVIWVTQAYLLASTIGLLLIGRVTDLIGRVKIYNYGFLIFTVGSALCSISFTPAELIAARIVQGTGSAMLITNSATILTDATPKEQLGMILGLNQIAFRIGSVAGLTLSGIIIAIADWRALFYINIPVGIFGTVWAHLRLKEVSTRDTAGKMDWPGFATFTAAVTLILLAITFLSYGLSDATTGIGLLLGGLGLFVVFVRIETRQEAPILDLGLFKIREFMGGNFAQILNAISFTGIILMISFYFQLALGMSPLVAGVSLLPLEAFYAVAGPLSGRLSDRYGPRLFSTIGLAVGSSGLFLLATATSSTAYGEIAVALALLGAGNGMFVSPNVSSIMGSVPPQRRGIASGFRSTMFNIGLTASSGIVILLVTTSLPYSVFSALLQGLTPSSLTHVAIEEFVSGFRITALILGIINTFAIVPSFLRGPRHAYEPSQVDQEP